LSHGDPDAVTGRQSPGSWPKAAPDDPPAAGPLVGLRVLELATVLAGPGAGRLLADLGADVVKVEHPHRLDPTRAMGFPAPDGGTSLLWRITSRNKVLRTADLKTGEGLAEVRAWAAEADVLIENFRPGTLERLGLAPEVLWEDNPTLVVTRVTGFGQHGPYAGRPGFATIAEAMSGFADINGAPDGPPILPPIALTDELTAVVAAYATMAAVHAGVGQVVDVSLLDSLFSFMGHNWAAYVADGTQQPRMGSQLPYSVPRNVYESADGHWLALSASADTVAARVAALVGVGDDERLSTFAGRVEHRDDLDAAVAAFIALRTRDEVLLAFRDADAAIAPIYSMADVAADPHFAERESTVTVDGIGMPGMLARFSQTPGRVRWAGRDGSADRTQPQ
jgi:crotonobetainyl-CoA:carnitine CoA-transferase CaiB-like acyl-CoA transferase